MIMILISGAFQTASAFDAKSFSLGFGPGEDKLMYYNSKIKDYEEPYPSGPSAFCIVKGNTVSVLDTFNNSLKQFDEKSKLIGVLNIFEIAKKGKLENLDKVSLEVGKPIKVMLAQKVGTIEEAFKAAALALKSRLLLL